MTTTVPLSRDQLITKAVKFTKALLKRYNLEDWRTSKNFEDLTMEELLKLSEYADADAAAAGK